MTARHRHPEGMQARDPSQFAGAELFSRRLHICHTLSKGSKRVCLQMSNTGGGTARVRIGVVTYYEWYQAFSSYDCREGGESNAGRIGVWDCGCGMRDCDIQALRLYGLYISRVHVPS